MSMPLDVPPLVRERATSNGVAGQRWLDELPEQVAALADRWGLALGRSFPGGTAAFVAAATDRSGRACVLKVAMPLDMDDGDSFARSVQVHQLASCQMCLCVPPVEPVLSALRVKQVGSRGGVKKEPLLRIAEKLQLEALRSFGWHDL